MFTFIKPSRFVLLYNYLTNTKQHLFFTARPFTCCYCNTRFNATTLRLNVTNCDPYKMIILREKSNKNKLTYKKETQEEEDDESDEEESEEESDFHFKGDEVKVYELQAARVDKIIKVCFKTSRKNIEDIFYQAKVRVNGKMLKKKSANAHVGDEIDIIHGFVNENSKLLSVNRIEILNIAEDPDNLKCSVKVKKSKSLVVENYNGSNEWRG